MYTLITLPSLPPSSGRRTGVRTAESGTADCKYERRFGGFALVERTGGATVGPDDGVFNDIFAMASRTVGKALAARSACTTGGGGAPHADFFGTVAVPLEVVAGGFGLESARARDEGVRMRALHGTGGLTLTFSLARHTDWVFQPMKDKLEC